jgi:hypothetical protein
MSRQTGRLSLPRHCEHGTSRRGRLAGRVAILAALLALFAYTPGTEGQGAKEPAAAGADKDDRIRTGDRLRIHATNTLPDAPIEGVFRVEPSGKLALGPHYGRVQLKDLTLEEAEVAIRQQLSKILRNVGVSVTRYDPLPRGRDLDREEALERRVRELEKELRALRDVVEQLRKKTR